MLIRFSVALAVGVVSLAGARPAAAQDFDASAPIFSNLERYLPSTPSPAHTPLMLPSGDARVLPQPRWQMRRPDRFESLCLSLVGLSVVDIVTTSQALHDGSGRELNPMLAPFASNTAALVASKVVVDAAVIFLARKIWHRDQNAAVNVLIVSNGIVGVGVVKNLSTPGPEPR